MSVEVDVGSNGAGGSWRDAEESQLVDAMRRGHDAAFAEVYRRFAPLLTRMARRRRVPDGERETLIMDYLEDTLMPVLRGRRPIPSPLGAYLAAGFRRRLISAWRSRQADDARTQRLEVIASAPYEHVVAEGLSEHAIRTASLGASEASGSLIGSKPDNLSEPLGDAAADPVREARTGLAKALADAMSPEERQLMGHVAERFPQREIAAGLGITPTAARVRIHRLRGRLMQVAVSYISALPVQDGILLAQFLDTPRALRMNSVRAQGGNDTPGGEKNV
ncbi:MAG: RNA polymerase sigma factor [Gemmatimonadaceae bacterium]